MGAPPASQLAVQCLAQFDECLLKHALAHNQWADNRRADFNIWVDGVGAMAGKTASLDARFESRPRELILTKNLLFQLGYYLEDALTVTDERELEEVKRNVDTSIENLASMAVAIRRTGRKSRLVRADASFNSASLDDLRKHLEFIVRLRPTLPGYRHPSHHKDDPHWWQRHIGAKLNPLQQRLIEANLRRRNRFLYAQSHSRKLAYRQLAEKLIEHQPQTEELMKHRSSTENPISQLPVRGASAQSHNLSTAKHLKIMPALSETLASTPESRLKWTEPNNRVRVAMTQMSRVTGTTFYPNLRNPQQSEAQGMGQDGTELPKMLKCPCCCEAIPSSMLKVESAWKKHLSKDLCPYTCIAANCPTPHVLYCTRAEWEDHLKEQHPKTWKCQLCDDPSNVVFHTDDQLLEHVSEEHMDSFPASLLGAVRLWPSSPSIGLKSCPLCYETGPRDAPSLIDHVLEHTHSFALRSLPWADLPVVDFEKPATFEWYNVSCLNPMKPTEPTAPLRQWLMHDWFEKMETPIPEKGGWERAEAALRDLAACRTRRDARNQPGYFATNDYFASEAEGLSLNIQASSRGSFDSEVKTEPAEANRNTSPGGEWSDLLWDQENQSHYRERRNNDGDLDTEWYIADSEQTTCESDQVASGHVIKPKGKDPVRDNDNANPSALVAFEAVRGHYVNAHSYDKVSTAATDGEVEELDPRFRVETSDKFQPGEIFKIHWSEPKGSGGETALPFLDQNVSMGFRRFIIIANDIGHCTCIPVLTYHGKACNRKGVNPMKHGVIYEKGKKPQLLSGEPKLGFAPVEAQITQAGERLYREHRVNYSKLVTVEHNVKVFFIGHIKAEDYDIVADAVNRCWGEKIHRRKRAKGSVEGESSTRQSTHTAED